MISIITVCYNSENTIKRTIESVLKQKNYQPGQAEHIFIDGNSVDHTVSIIEGYQVDYKEKGIEVVIISEKDKGIYDAMNKGITKAKGDIIGILNSDDWYEDSTLDLVNRLMINNPDMDILMGALKVINKGEVLVKKIKKSLWITSRNFNHPSMFVRKRCYEEVGGYDISMLYADFDWFLKAKKSGKKVCYTSKVLANFMVGGISNQKSIKKVIFRIGDRYKAYRNNGYSRMYIGECILQEAAKYCLVRQ